MAEVVDYSLKHQFLGSLQGSGGEHQLSDEQVEDDSQISVVDRNVNETITFAMRQVTKRKRPCRWINFGEMVFLLGCRSSLKMTVTNFLKKWTLWVSTKIFAIKVRCLIYPDLPPHCCRQIRGGTHPGHHLLYEFHSNQTGSPDKVGSFCDVCTKNVLKI